MLNRSKPAPEAVTDKKTWYPLPSEEGTLLDVEWLLPECQGQNLALTVLYVPYSLESGY